MQTPISANSHYEVQQKIALTSTAAVKKLWGRMGSEFDQSWAQIRQPVLQVVQNGRLAAATDASRYTGQVLAETGQAAAPFGAIIPAAFVEYTPTGTDVGAYLDSAVVRSKQAVASGADIRTALRTGGDWLTGSLLTMFADTARDVVSADIAQRPKVTGYVRMLNTPSCARCVILAGKWFRWNEGFLRHPRCDCRHIPASEDVAGSYQTDPYEYFKSLSVRDQEKLFGKREAEAIRDYGADIYRTMNIKMRGLGTAKSNRIYGTPNKRTVNDILSRDPSRKYVIENLQYHGYITGPQVRGGNIIGTGPQAERFAGMDRGKGSVTVGGKQVKTARASIVDARTTGVRDPLNRSTMTAAERRLYDANYRLEYARTTGLVPKSVGQNSADLFTQNAVATAADIADLERKLAVELAKVPYSAPSVQLLAKKLGHSSGKVNSMQSGSLTFRVNPRKSTAAGSGGKGKPPVNIGVTFPGDDPISPKLAKHILDGEGSPTFKGGHRFSSRIVGKSVFPESWSDETILDAVRQTLGNPQFNVYLGQTLVLRSLVDEVVIEVRLKKIASSFEIETAFPVNGSGVFLNSTRGRVQVPLDLSALEA